LNTHKHTHTQNCSDAYFYGAHTHTHIHTQNTGTGHTQHKHAHMHTHKCREMGHCSILLSRTECLLTTLTPLTCVWGVQVCVSLCARCVCGNACVCVCVSACIYGCVCGNVFLLLWTPPYHLRVQAMEDALWLYTLRNYASMLHHASKQLFCMCDYLSTPKFRV